MAVQMREPVTTTTPCSSFIEAGAVRLFCAGYLGALRFNHREDDHWYYTLPSESEPGVIYQIDHCPNDGTIRCSCPAGQNNVPCKHVRLFQLSRGWAVREAGHGRHGNRLPSALLAALPARETLSRLDQ